jgi:hypothetical protein
MSENLLPPDPVAILLGIQENFGIIVSDDEAAKISTMGQLYDFVLARVARNQSQVCVTGTPFYDLRRALRQVCGAPRERVRPVAELEQLIPFDGRRHFWQELQARFSNLPTLRRSARLEGWISAASFVPMLVMSLLFFFALVGHIGRPHPAVFITFLANPIVGSIGMLVVSDYLCRRTEHYAVYIPPTCETVRDMVYTLVSANPAAPMVSDTVRATDKEIWNALCAIVGAEFDRPAASFTRESRLN